MKQLIFLSLLSFCLPVFAQSNILIDSSNEQFISSIEAISSRTGMIVSMKHRQTGHIDTLYNNYPSVLLFQQLVDNKYYVMVLENFQAYIYRYYEWNGRSWEFVRGNAIEWKHLSGFDTGIRTAITIVAYNKIKVVVSQRERDYFKEKLRVDEREYLWTINLQTKKIDKKKKKVSHHYVKRF